MTIGMIFYLIAAIILFLAGIVLGLLLDDYSFGWVRRRR
jgi:hypothetical protein